MIHSLSAEQEAAGLFLETTDPGWAETGTTPGIQHRAREKVRQAIKISLGTPCAGSHLEDELPQVKASPPAKPIPAFRKVRAHRQPRPPLNPLPIALGTATALPILTDLGIATNLENALAPAESLQASQGSRAAPN